jgi:DNA-binding response OmpR family regulator
MENLILIVDDEYEIGKAIQILLKKENLNSDIAVDGIMALELLETKEYSLIIMDIMMPRLDGLSALIKTREKNNVPVIIMSAKSEDSDKVLGLSMGADDYITKPFNSMELIARVKSHLRRYNILGSRENNGVIGSNLLVNGLLTLDMDSKQAFMDEENIKLTPTEYRILELFMSNLNKVFSANQIYEKVWNEDAYSVENTVMVHIRRIREKIEFNPKEPKYIKVVWGIGYKMEKF